MNASWTYFLSSYPRPARTAASSRRTGGRGGGDQGADQPHRVRDQPGGLAQAGVSAQVTSASDAAQVLVKMVGAVLEQTCRGRSSSPRGCRPAAGGVPVSPAGPRAGLVPAGPRAAARIVRLASAARPGGSAIAGATGLLDSIVMIVVDNPARRPGLRRRLSAAQIVAARRQIPITGPDWAQLWVAPPSGACPTDPGCRASAGSPSGHRRRGAIASAGHATRARQLVTTLTTRPATRRRPGHPGRPWRPSTDLN